MSPSTSLRTVEDDERRRELRAATSSILTRTAGGKLAAIKRPGWIAVAAEAGMLNREEWRRALVDMLRRDGVDLLYAVPLDRANGEPPLEVPATEEDLAAALRQLGSFDFVLYPPDVRWAIVSTTEDIAAFFGPPPVVADLLGGDPAAAREGLEDFLDDPGFWPEKVLAYFRSLIAAIEAYNGLADGATTELPINV
jgi:hypothetical protein